MSQLPQVRLQPFYPGQMGVPGSDVPRGLRWVSGRTVFHVNHLHPAARDANDGTDPENPKVTIQSAVDSPWLSRGDVIVVGPSTQGDTYTGISLANYHENVVISHTHPSFVTLMAAGTSPFQVVWNPAVGVTNLPCLRIDSPGWVVSGFKFHPPASAAGIYLSDEGMGPPAGDMTQYTIIEDNYFDGAWAGLYGVELVGTPGNTVIRHNWFLEHHQQGGTAYAIRSTATPNADPYECILEDNIFMENDNHVDVTYGMSLIQRNKFFLGSILPATVKLDLRGGTVGLNIVTANVFDGVYSNAGGYYANAGGDFWVGNVATPNGGTVADNGLTVLVPA